MKAIALLLLVAVAAADRRPVNSYSAPSRSYDRDQVEIIRDDRIHPDAQGRYSFTVETEDGIYREESGGEYGNQQGSIRYTAPDGTLVHLSFVADENGYQPQGEHLPVAPEFPHPIPQFVLDQIAKAAEEDRSSSKGSSDRYAYSRK